MVRSPVNSYSLQGNVCRKYLIFFLPLHFRIPKLEGSAYSLKLILITVRNQIHCAMWKIYNPLNRMAYSFFPCLFSICSYTLSEYLVSILETSLFFVISTGLSCEASLLLLITAAVLMMDILDSLNCPELDTVAVPILAAGHGTD